MLPQLDPGVGPRGPRGQERQGPAIAVDGQDRAGREVHADADDCRRIDARGAQGGGNGRFDRFSVVARMLERPIARKPLGGFGKRFGDHAVPIRGDGGAALAPGARLDDERPHGRGAEIEAERAGLGGPFLHAPAFTNDDRPPDGGPAYRTDRRTDSPEGRAHAPSTPCAPAPGSRSRRPARRRPGCGSPCAWPSSGRG